MTVTAVVLCGGGSTRFGADKTSQPLGETTVLDHLVDSLPTTWAVVAVGTPRPLGRAVAWAREDPPGGGPLAGIAAGIRGVTADVVVVIAGDMPFAGPWAVRLVDALAGCPDVGAVTSRDGDDRANPLLTAYRTDALREALPHDPSGGSARFLLQAIEHESLLVPDEESLDVDTPEALEAARHRLGP